MKAYPLDQCGLSCVRTKSRLARVLGRSIRFLDSRAHDPEMYRVWQEQKKSGGYRTIEAPRDDLKALQRRIADLLQRVLPPGFLYSPVKGKSYIDNALVHRTAREFRLLDVVNYFGSCDERAVYRFFAKDLRCSPDVAWILTGLATREGHLPQGSPCSPILSFYACQPMWAEVAKVVETAGCKLTVYVDDVTVSGEDVPESLVWRIKEILHNHGHKHHPKKERRRRDRPAEVTGIIIKDGKGRVPHRHYRKMLAARLEARNAGDETVKASALARARSLEAQVQFLNRQ